MDNEPYRDLTHDEAADLVAATAQRAGNKAYREFPLPNGRVADVLIKTAQGNIEIIEVKLNFKASYAESAFDKYWPYCHRLYLAIPGLAQQHNEPDLWPLRWSTNAERVGLIGVDLGGLTWLRIPDTHAMLFDAQQSLLRTLPR